MSSNFTLKLDPERLKEMPMVDLAFEVLKAANTPYYYRDLMMEIAKVRKLSADDINQVIAQVYTEINIDGRFACVGSNMWGLKRWYPVERNEDPIANAKRPRIINDEDDDDDDDFTDEDDTFSADDSDEDFDRIDEDHDDIYSDDDSEEEVEEEGILEDEELEDEEEDLDEDEEDSADESEED